MNDDAINDLHARGLLSDQEVAFLRVDRATLEPSDRARQIDLLTIKGNLAATLRRSEALAARARDWRNEAP